MATTINLLSDTSELVELFAPQQLYLKPIARLNITVQLPQLKDPGQTINNWDIMEKVKRIISPNHFSYLKVSKSTLEFVRFEAEVENRDTLQKIVKVLDNATIKMIGFFETFKVKAAEGKSDFPSKHDWDSYFRDAKNVDECKAGERPDTISFSKLPSKWFQDLRPNKGKDNRAKNEPSEFVLRRVFETFGEVRCVDIPQIDPSRASSSTIKMFNFGGEFTFDAYVQYVEYISFMKAMDTLRNMQLVHIDEEGKAFAANIKVDFDRTKQLTDKNIRRRRLIREAFMQSEKIRLEKLRKAEEEEKRRAEEERLQLEYETQTLTKEKLKRRREREEKRRLKQLELKRKEEESFIERKIKSEERRLIKAQRQLESIRLLSELFKLAKPIKLKEQVEKELFELEDAQLRENQKRERLEQEERDRRERLLRKREFMLRNNVVKKYQEIEDKREEFKREELRKKVRSSGILRSVAAQPIRHRLPSYSAIDSSEEDEYYFVKKHSVQYFNDS